MVYDLVLLIHGNMCKVMLKLPAFEQLIQAYKDMGIVFEIVPVGVPVDQDQYRLIVKVFGSATVFDIDRNVIIKHCLKIIEFDKVQCFYKPRSVRNESKAFTQTQTCAPVHHVIYCPYYNKSLVYLRGIELCQWYDDFQMVEVLDNVETAMSFFHNQMWKDKDELYKKLLAYKILFD